MTAELDRLMAEKVMGWHLVDFDWIDADGKPVASTSKNIYFHYWSPSTDIAQAILCAETWRTKDVEHRSWSLHSPDEPGYLWECVLYFIDNQEIDAISDISDAAAICNALALAVKGE